MRGRPPRSRRNTSSTGARADSWKVGFRPNDAAAAWTDPSVNVAADGFFFDTLQTLQSAYVRPRFDGFVRFFEAAGIEINRYLRREVKDVALIRWLNERYAMQRVAARQIA